MQGRPRREAGLADTQGEEGSLDPPKGYHDYSDPACGGKCFLHVLTLMKRQGKRDEKPTAK